MDTNTLNALDPVNKKSVRFGRPYFRWPESVKNELTKRARKRRMSLNAYVLHLVIEDLKKK